MNVEPQGRNECWLATLAALSHRPLAEVRALGNDVGREVAGPDWTVGWSSLWTTASGNWSRVTGAVLDRVGASPALRVLMDSSRAGTTCRADAPLVVTLPPRIRNLPAEGRGVIRLRSRGGSVQHVLPWENGFAYDPQLEPGETQVLPRTLAQIRARARGWRVIVRVEVETDA